MDFRKRNFSDQTEDSNSGGEMQQQQQQKQQPQQDKQQPSSNVAANAQAASNFLQLAATPACGCNTLTTMTQYLMQSNSRCGTGKEARGTATTSANVYYPEVLGGGAAALASYPAAPAATAYGAASNKPTPLQFDLSAFAAAAIARNNQTPAAASTAPQPAPQQSTPPQPAPQATNEDAPPVQQVLAQQQPQKQQQETLADPNAMQALLQRLYLHQVLMNQYNVAAAALGGASAQQQHIAPLMAERFGAASQFKAALPKLRMDAAAYPGAVQQQLYPSTSADSYPLLSPAPSSAGGTPKDANGSFVYPPPSMVGYDFAAAKRKSQMSSISNQIQLMQAYRQSVASNESNLSQSPASSSSSSTSPFRLSANQRPAFPPRPLPATNPVLEFHWQQQQQQHRFPLSKSPEMQRSKSRNGSTASFEESSNDSVVATPLNLVVRQQGEKCGTSISKPIGIQQQQQQAPVLFTHATTLKTKKVAPSSGASRMPAPKGGSRKRSQDSKKPKTSNSQQVQASGNGGSENRVGAAKRYKRYSKPPFSYVALIVLAIASSKNKRLQLSQILTRISEMFPFFKGPYQGWRDSIRHNLSQFECFIKTLKNPFKPHSKGNYWSVDISAIPRELLLCQNTQVSRGAGHRYAKDISKVFDLETGLIRTPMPPTLLDQNGRITAIKSHVIDLLLREQNVFDCCEGGGSGGGGQQTYHLHDVWDEAITPPPGPTIPTLPDIDLTQQPTSEPASSIGGARKRKNPAAIIDSSRPSMVAIDAPPSFDELGDFGKRMCKM